MGTESFPLFLIPLLPLLGAFINLVFGRVIGSRGFVHFVAVAAVASSFGVALWLVGGPLLRAYGLAEDSGLYPALHQNLFTWIEVGRLKIDMAFTLDTLSAVMVLLITFVGTLIHIYSTGYMAHEPRYSAYFGYLNLFTGAMLILVLGDNLPVLFIGWEGVGLCSYLLIGFWFENESYANAGRKAFVVNRIGDFSFLIGMFLLFWAVGSLDFATLRGDAAVATFASALWGERMAFWAGLFLFIGACGKSAQIPLYVWLPDAMAGPTPVSALIHAATMVTAGVYLVARLSYLYASSATAMIIVATVGALTALVAAFMAFAQTDLKKVLAYSTVSQLGFMFVGVGVGAYVAGIFHVLTHGFFKAGLFLGAGSVMHAMSGSGDIMKMGGLRKKLPVTHATFLIYCIAIAGIFPLSGFFSKDEILAGAFYAAPPDWPLWYGKVLWAVLSLAALGTAFYMFRLYFLVFSGECRADAETQSHIHESPGSMTFPLIVLAGFTLILGYIGLPHLELLPHLPGQISSWLKPAIVEELGAAHVSDATTLVLIGVALMMGTIGIVLAYSFYKDGPSTKVQRWVAGNSAFAGLYRASQRKLWVDETYEVGIIRPFRWLARASFDFVDRFVIDLIFVNGSAFVVDSVGRGARWVQNGQVQRYLVGILLGAAVILFFAFRPSASFDYVELGGNRVLFIGSAGDGPAQAGAEITWDLDSDGDLDATGDSPVFQYTSEGKHKVTMTAREGVFGGSRTITKWIDITGIAAPELLLPSDAVEGGAQ